ncbi:DUF11 domain-containing protein [Flavobacterium sp. F-65]|uniref:DUF11 domain-containing protein n=1 Tax=Flavobacterium pisciphilum TaxID=2893755 RepID=A0ABS8MZW5_9FLAO|nr:gliding motility-associated C-terminal domain-containing protein [Flavobacterium sp. F-65]MCC9074333.1 DUF11 domain-containing protein [Flavobacterium sp. F-65]
MKNIKIIITLFCFLPLVGLAQTADFTAVSTPAYCFTDGTITVTATNTVGRVQYELVSYRAVRSAIGVPQDDPFFSNLAPGTYTVGIYDDNNTTTPITKEVVVEDRRPSNTLTISNISSAQLAYCTGSPDPGARLYTTINGGSAPYDVAVLDASDNIVDEITNTYNLFNSFLAIPAGTYKIRVKDNCGTVVNSNSPHVVKPNIVYDFNVSTPTFWYWDNNVKVTHSGAGTVCDPVTDAYYDFNYSGGIPVITGNDVFPISQGPGVSTRMYAVEYDGIKTPYMTYDELRAYKQPLPIDINAWKPMTMWVSICGVEKSTVYNFPSRKNDFLPKLIANAGITFYIADDKSNTLCTPTGYVTLSRFSLLSGFCDPLTLTVTEKNGVEPPKQYTITGASQNDFEAQLAIGNTYILKLTDVNGSELNRFSYINVTRGQYLNTGSRTEIFLDPVLFRPSNQDDLPFELVSMADFKNFGKSQLGIKTDYAIPVPYTITVTGPNGYNFTKTINTTSYNGTLISNNLAVGAYSVRINSVTGCYDKTFPITLDRIIDRIAVTTTITPDPVACDRYVKSMNYRVHNQGELRPYPSTSFESMFNVPFVNFVVADGPAGLGYPYAVVGNSIGWNMSSQNVTAVFRGDITGLYKINLVEDRAPGKPVIEGPWEVDVKSEFPVFDMNGSGGAICTGSTTGTLGVVIRNATNPVYYLKKATDSNYPAVGQSSAYFPNLVAGDYMVKVETACYPTALEASFKMDYISNITDIISGANELCDTDQLNFSIKSLGAVTNVKWKLPDGSIQTTENLVLDNPQAGEYSVNVTTRSGCIVTDKIEVKIKARAVAADILVADSVICSGETTTLQAASTTITNPLFTWYSDASLTNVLGTGADFTTPVLAANSMYYVTAQSADFCENIPTEAKVVTVTVNLSATAADIIADSVGTCSGSTAILNADSTTITNPIFTWYSDANLTNVLGTGADFTTPVLTAEEIYYVTVKGDNACENLPGTAKEVNVTINPALVVTPPVPQIVGNQCTLPTINFDSNDPGTLYVWSVDDWSIGLEDNWISSPNIPSFKAINTGTTPVTATVTVHPIGTVCGAGSFTFTITVNPDIVLTQPADQKICTNTIVSEIDFVSNITGTTYSWVNDNPNIGLAAAGTGNIPAFTAINNDHFTAIATITVTPTANGCIGTPVTFTIEVNPEGKIDILGNQTICMGETAMLSASSMSVINPEFTWYSDETLTNVLSTDAIYSVKPLVTTIYYVTIKGDNACEANTGMPVTVIVNEIVPPTGNATQEFCLASNATVADLVTNESNVVWYDAAIAGNIVSSGTALVDGVIYYGLLNVGACESSTRLAVTAIMNEVVPPTGNATQEFCLASNATVADLVTNESNVVWYDAAIAGNIVSSGTALVDGVIYYGLLNVGTCESSTRLAVTAIMNEVVPPTGNATQEFCLASNATVADLVTNESNVVWYDAAIAGNIVLSGTALVDGVIYYGLLNVGACESSTRLAVTAIIKADLPGETIGWNTAACIADEVTYKTSTGMSDYNWIVAGGTISAGGKLDDDFVTIKWTTAGNGSVGVAFINAFNCDPIVTIHFPVTIAVCSDIAIGKVVNNPKPSVGENVIFTITASNIGTESFQNVSISEMLPSGYQFVNATASSGDYNNISGIWNVSNIAAGATQTLTLTAKVMGTGDYLNIAYLIDSTPTDHNPDNNRAEAAVVPVGIIIYNAVSANGDGVNDYFKIDGLEHYPDNTVEIYNRWGVKIYEADGYGLNDNVFRGISAGRATMKKGQVVPAGTYFYILRYRLNAESRIEKSGYLYVK